MTDSVSPATTKFTDTPPPPDALHHLLADQIEADAFAEALQTADALLAANPNDADALEARAYLTSQAASRGAFLRALAGHGAWVNGVAFSPDGQRLATAGGGALVAGEFKAGPDCSVRLWDVETGSELLCCKGHGSMVTAVAFSPDGRSVLSASRGGSLCLWNADTGKPIQVIKRLSVPVWSVAYVSSGRVLSASDDNQLRLWDAYARERLVRYTGHARAVMSVAVAPHGRHAVSGGYDNAVIVWDVDSGMPLRRFNGHSQGVLSVAFSADGNSVLSASSDRTIRLWDYARGRELCRVESDLYPAASVAILPDGRRIVTGHADASVRLWDLMTGRELARFVGHEDAVTSVACSADGRTAASGSRDQTARLWRLPA